MRGRLPTITMMTDFGIKDGNVGVMRGVMWSICPDAQIADISHMIGAQNVTEAAVVLSRSAPYFPAGTIHMVVVDPGVGTARRPMAARIGQSYFVGPDNGVITLWLEGSRGRGERADFVHLNRSAFWRAEVSNVFHGRDIFSPVAAHLAAGVPLQDLGSALEDPVLLEIPRPRRIPGGLEGEIIHIDHFGNAASNITLQDLIESSKAGQLIEVQAGATRISGLVRTFGDRPAGTVVALIGSTGNLIVSVVNGNAAATLDFKVGDSVRVLALAPPLRAAGGSV